MCLHDIQKVDLYLQFFREHCISQQQLLLQSLACQAISLLHTVLYEGSIFLYATPASQPPLHPLLEKNIYPILGPTSVTWVTCCWIFIGSSSPILLWLNLAGLPPFSGFLAKLLFVNYYQVYPAMDPNNFFFRSKLLISVPNPAFTLISYLDSNSAYEKKITLPYLSSSS